MLSHPLNNNARIAAYVVVAAMLVVIGVVVNIHAAGGSSTVRKCSSIILQQDRNACLTSLASSSNNASVCGMVSQSGKDYCYSEVAQADRNPRACTYLSSNNMTYECILEVANATRGYGACRYLNGSMESSCIETLAAITGNSTACGTISNGENSTVCYSGVYLSEAKRSGHAYYCTMVSNTSTVPEVSNIVYLGEIGAANASYSGVGTPGQGPSVYLSEYNISYSAKDYCYAEIASDTGNATDCAMVSNSIVRGICNQTSGTQTAQSNIQINSSTISSACGTYSGENFTTCQGILQIGEAISSKNASNCGSISETIYKYECYAALAKAYNDSSFCGYISNSTASQACMQDIYYNYSATQ